MGRFFAAACPVRVKFACEFIEIEGNPVWFMGRAGRMNTGVVFVSLMFWGWIWGVWGLLFAVPIMMCVKACGDHIPEYDFVRELLRE